MTSRILGVLAAVFGGFLILYGGYSTVAATMLTISGAYSGSPFSGLLMVCVGILFIIPNSAMCKRPVLACVYLGVVCPYVVWGSVCLFREMFSGTYAVVEMLWFCGGVIFLLTGPTSLLLYGWSQQTPSEAALTEDDSTDDGHPPAGP